MPCLLLLLEMLLWHRSNIEATSYKAKEAKATATPAAPTGEDDNATDKPHPAAPRKNRIQPSSKATRSVAKKFSRKGWVCFT